MSEKETKKRLKQTMALLKIKIENLKPHTENSERMNNMYNKMLIEKAIVKNELDEMGKSKPSLIEKLANMIKSKNKKLISDYFQS